MIQYNPPAAEKPSANLITAQITKSEISPSRNSTKLKTDSLFCLPSLFHFLPSGVMFFLPVAGGSNPVFYPRYVSPSYMRSSLPMLPYIPHNISFCVPESLHTLWKSPPSSESLFFL